MILSPIKGTLVSSSVKQGDTIFSGQVLGEIQSDERIIEVTLKEEDFDGIVEGQKWELPSSLLEMKFSRVWLKEYQQMSIRRQDAENCLLN